MMNLLMDRSRRLLALATALVLTGSSGLVYAGPRPLVELFLPWTATEGRDGNFYGAIYSAGLDDGGVIYSMSPSGKLRLLHHFRVTAGVFIGSRVGTFPKSPVSIGQDGAIYGTTSYGGVFGHGVLYKLDPHGAFSILHHFEFGFQQGLILASRSGDIYVADWDWNKILKISRDGRVTHPALNGTPVALAETTGGEIIVGTSNLSQSAGSVRFAGNLCRLHPDEEFEVLADVMGSIRSLEPLPDGSLLCLTRDGLLEVSAAGELSSLHEFPAANWYSGPSFVTVARDGSYIGNTIGDSQDTPGFVFRIVPDSHEYTILDQLPELRDYQKHVEWMEKVFPLRAAAEAGNAPPMTRDDVVEAAGLRPASAGGLPSGVVDVLKNDADADGDPLSIVSVSPPAHGVVDFDFIAQKITYTADSAIVENDSFTYTVVDGSGGRGIGQVIVRARVAGTYSGDVSSIASATTGDPGTVVGALTVHLNSLRTLSARLDLFGRRYRFTGRFTERNRFGAVLTANTSTNKTTALQLWLRPNGAGWNVEATIDKNLIPFTATCSIPPAP